MGYRLYLVIFCLWCVIGCSTRQVYQNAENISANLPSAVNINIATAGELETLPNIGRKTAENIIRFREENGPFRRTEHLMLIRGISEKRYLAIRQFVKIE